jgi:hypothetical protein
MGFAKYAEVIARMFILTWRCAPGDRKTRVVCNTHDLGALAPLGLPD